MTGVCQCGATVELVAERGVLRFANHGCKGTPLVEAQTPPTPASPWSAAKPTECGRGHRHGSKNEARLCGVVHAEAAADEVVFVGARCVLWAVDPDEKGPLYFRPDFVVVGPDLEGRRVPRRCYDAKGRQSRDWRRGKAAFETTYRIKVEEVR